MAKRNAANELNRDNWDEEEESEDAGQFKKASADELKTRVIKTARRRNIGGSSGSSEISTKAIFGSFTGFKSATEAAKTNTNDTNKASPFSFLSNISAVPKTTENKGAAPAFSLNNGIKENGDNSVYLSKLKGLNQAVLQWITKHVNENPICILSPIFKDYEEHLKKLQDESPSATSSTAASPTPAASVPTFKSTPTTATSSFKFESTFSDPPKDTTIKPTAAAAPTFSFGVNTSNSTDSTKSEAPKLSGIFSMGSRMSSTSSSMFGTSKPFTFSNVVAPPSDKPQNGGGEAEDDEDQPPKVEFTPIVEDGSVYSKRCKIFVKKDTAFTDRGVGTLHIKIVEDGNKIQLLVRADISLGTILLNVLLTPTFPLQKMKKNNILLICLPTPDAKPPATSVLIRLKNEDEADEVMNEIKKLIPNE